MNKTVIYVILAVATIAAWWYFFQRKQTRAAWGQDGIPDEDGFFFFRYHGGSALRQDDMGNDLDCGVFNMPAGEPAPTNFYSFLEIGKLSTNGAWTAVTTGNCLSGGCRILPGDVIENVEIIYGAENTNVPLQGNNFEVLQLGTDNCTPTGDVKWPNNGILIDLVTKEQGATESNYQTNGDVFGRFRVKTN